MRVLIVRVFSVGGHDGLSSVFFPVLLLFFLRRNEQNSAIVFGAFFVVVVSGLLFCSSCVSGGAHSVCDGSLVLAKVLAWCCAFLLH